jgi:hypothetical protein
MKLGDINMPGLVFPHTCTLTHIPEIKCCFMVGGGIPPTVAKLSCKTLKSVFMFDFTDSTVSNVNGKKVH